MKQFISALGLIALLASVSTVKATESTWVGGGFSFDWTDVDNWLDTMEPASYYDIDLSYTGANSTCVFDSGAAATSFGALTIGNSMIFQVDKASLSFTSINFDSSWSMTGNEDIACSGPMSLTGSSATVDIDTDDDVSDLTVASLSIDADTANASRSLTKAGDGELVAGATYLYGDLNASSRPAVLTHSDGALDVGDLNLVGGISGSPARFVYSGGTLTNPNLLDMSSYVEINCSTANVDVLVDGDCTVHASGRNAVVSVQMASGKKLKPTGFVIEGAASTYSAECTVTSGAIETR